MKPNQVKQLVFSAIGLALVFLTTMFIKVPSPVTGYVNLGDGVIMIFASMSPISYAFLIGGVGSMLADIAGGYASYAVFTLFIKGIEGALVSFIIHKYGRKKRLLATIIGALVMIVGYFIADWVINQSAIVGIAGLWLNILQGTLGVVIATILIPRLYKYYRQMFRRSKEDE